RLLKSLFRQVKQFLQIAPTGSRETGTNPESKKAPAGEDYETGIFCSGFSAFPPWKASPYSGPASGCVCNFGPGTFRLFFGFRFCRQLCADGVESCQL